MNYKQSINYNKNISLDDICYLLSMTIEKDELLQEIEVPNEREVFCSTQSVNRYEFNSGGSNGIKPKYTFLVDYDEYNDETDVKYNGNVYSIYRTFARYDGYIELHAEVRVGGQYGN